MSRKANKLPIVESALHSICKDFHVMPVSLGEAVRKYPQAINTADKSGNTPLTLLVLNKCVTYHLIKVLLTCPNIDICLAPKLKQNALCIICSKPTLDYDIVKVFLRKDNKCLQAVDSKGFTPLMITCKNPKINSDILKLMIDGWPDGLALKSSEGLDAFGYLCNNPQVKIGMLTLFDGKLDADLMAIHLENISKNSNFNLEIFKYFISLKSEYKHAWHVIFTNIYSSLSITDELVNFCQIYRKELSEKTEYSEAQEYLNLNLLKLCLNKRVTYSMLSSYIQENDVNINCTFPASTNTPIIIISESMNECYYHLSTYASHGTFEALECILNHPTFDPDFNNQAYRSLEYLSNKRLNPKVFGVFLSFGTIVEKMRDNRTVLMNIIKFKYNMVNYSNIILDNLDAVLSIYDKETAQQIFSKDFWDNNIVAIEKFYEMDDNACCLK